MKTRIHIIGGGNLGTAIARGLAAYPDKYAVSVSRRHIHLIADLKEKGIRLSSDNAEFLDSSRIIILAVKPKQAEELLARIRSQLKSSGQILISTVTGLALNTLSAWSGKKNSLFRAMPNTAISVQKSMTCISSLESTGQEKKLVQDLFDKLGNVAWIDEDLMDAATVLGACGLAFAMRYIRAAMQAGIEIGFDSQTALAIAAQTVRGAATLLLRDLHHPEYEIDKVTTPQGCTIAGLNEMEHEGFSSAVIKGVIRSFTKIDQMKK